MSVFNWLIRSCESPALGLGLLRMPAFPWLSRTLSPVSAYLSGPLLPFQGLPEPYDLKEPCYHLHFLLGYSHLAFCTIWNGPLYSLVSSWVSGSFQWSLSSWRTERSNQNEFFSVVHLHPVMLLVQMTLIPSRDLNWGHWLNADQKWLPYALFHTMQWRSQEQMDNLESRVCPFWL